MQLISKLVPWLSLLQQNFLLLNIFRAEASFKVWLTDYIDSEKQMFLHPQKINILDDS